MSATVTAQLETVGLWMSFLLALFTFSAILRDNYLSRLAQHIFVGAMLGYMAVLLIQNVLRPRLITPLVQSGGTELGVALPALFGVLLVAAGVDRTIVQGKPAADSTPLWRRLLHATGMAAVALLLGVGISTAVIGGVEGTLAPQFTQVLRSGMPESRPSVSSGEQLATALVALLVTTGVLVHLFVEPALAASEKGGAARAARVGVALWSWLGKRVLWFSAGVIFARLVLSRVSILGAQIDFFVQFLQQTPVWRLIAALDGWLGL